MDFHRVSIEAQASEEALESDTLGWLLKLPCSIDSGMTSMCSDLYHLIQFFVGAHHHSSQRVSRSTEAVAGLSVRSEVEKHGRPAISSIWSSIHQQMLCFDPFTKLNEFVCKQRQFPELGYWIIFLVPRNWEKSPIKNISVPSLMSRSTSCLSEIKSPSPTTRKSCLFSSGITDIAASSTASSGWNAKFFSGPLSDTYRSWVSVPPPKRLSRYQIRG